MSSTPAIRLDTADSGHMIPWLHDTQIRMPIRRQDTGNAYSAQLNEVGPGYFNPPHCHGREDEVFYVIEGSVTLRAGHDEVTLGAGDLLFAPRGVPHQLTNPTDQPASLLVLLTPGDLEDAFVAGSKNLDQLGEAFTQAGVVMLDEFDPDFVHPEVGEKTAAPFVARAADRPKFWMAGDTYTILLPGEVTDDRLAVVHFDLPPGVGPIPHVHRRDDEVFAVLDGQVTLYADGQILTAGPGDVAWLPRGLPHGFKNRSDQPAQMLALVNPSGFDRMIAEVGQPAVANQPPPPIDDTEKQRLRDITPKYDVEMRPDIDFD